MKNRPKEPAKGGGEEDVLTCWRHWLCWCQRSGATSYWKRRNRRRMRRRGKEECNER